MRLSTKLALTMAMVLGLVTVAKGQDETPGQQVTITAAVPATGHSCGHSSYPLYCYGIPADVGGSFWIDVYYAAYGGPTGFIAFNEVLDLGMARVTDATLTYIQPGQPFAGYPLTIHLVLDGVTNDGDSDSYSGVADFTFSYVAVGACSGRGCSRLPIRYVQSGTMTITYN